MKEYALKKAFFLHQHQKARNFVSYCIYRYIVYEIDLFFSVHMKKFLCSEEAPMIEDSIEIELKKEKMIFYTFSFSLSISQMHFFGFLTLPRLRNRFFMNLILFA